MSMENGDLNFSIFPASDFRIAYATAIEEAFDHLHFIKWCRLKWTISITWAIAYLVFVYIATRLMADRKPVSLRGALIFWNGCLAIFSICGAIRTLPELLFVLYNYGFVFSVCNPSYLLTNSYAFWGNLFLHSKIIELGDTVFIILRKQPLIFLHWYHHATVLIYTWYAYTEVTGTGRWFATMNFIVHSFMYTYYFFRAARWQLPKIVSITVTSLQIVQMVMGLFVIIVAFVVKVSNSSCQQSYENMFFAVSMYLSYLVLFVRFFYVTYMKPKQGKFVKAE